MSFYENEGELHQNKSVGGTYSPINCFAQRLVLTQRHKEHVHTELMAY